MKTMHKHSGKSAPPVPPFLAKNIDYAPIPKKSGDHYFLVEILRWSVTWAERQFFPAQHPGN